MNQCFNCMYMHPDWDTEGNVIRPEYCHFDGPEEWAPCYEEEPDELYDYPESEVEWEDEARWVHEFGQPYDYQEF